MNIQAKLVAAAGLVILLTLVFIGTAHHYEARGHTLERAEWLQRQVQWDLDKAKLIADNEKHNQQVLLENQAKERKTSELHEQEVAQVRADLDTARRAVVRNGGLRISASVCADTSGTQGSTEATSTSGRNDTSPGTVALPQQVQDDLWSIVKEADEVNAQLRACQGWIKLQGFYGDE